MVEPVWMMRHSRQTPYTHGIRIIITIITNIDRILITDANIRNSIVIIIIIIIIIAVVTTTTTTIDIVLRITV